MYVDYFHHTFNSIDLHNNWKSQTKEKSVESIRLENILWRRYNQTRFQIQKLDPRLIYWNKGEEWLFGPVVVVEGEVTVG
jgi:hypothetical protein